MNNDTQAAPGTLYSSSCHFFSEDFPSLPKINDDETKFKVKQAPGPRWPGLEGHRDELLSMESINFCPQKYVRELLRKISEAKGDNTVTAFDCSIS